ncbi:MAG: long-chain fatty acid--CoA ligase [Pacificimonas sp.]
MTSGWPYEYQHPVPWAQTLAPRALPDMLTRTAARKPDARCVDFLGKTYSYGEIADLVARAAAGFRKLGVKRGVHVGLFLPNCPQYVIAYYAILTAGGTVVNFSPLYTADELAHQAEDAAVRIMVTLDVAQLFPTIAEVQQRGALDTLIVGNLPEVLPGLKSFAYRLFKRGDRAKVGYGKTRLKFSDLLTHGPIETPADIDPGTDIAVIQYTGGTTGRPKGALLTHANMSINAAQVHAIDPDAGAHHRILGALPLFHVFANTCVLNRTVLAGDEMVLLPKFELEEALETIAKKRITALPGVPTMYQAMLDHPKTAGLDLTCLRICISGGAPMAKELREAFIEKTGAKLVEGYGLTESSGVVSVNPYESGGKIGSIGQPLPGTEIVIVDREDPSRVLSQGEHGEITITGPQIMHGYWNRPDAAGDTFVDGRLRTGDVGYIDEDGFVFIVDRIKDLILVGGFNVYPSAVEEILYSHDAVKEAIVIGIDDPRLGQRPKGFVTLEDGADITGDQLATWANGHLGKHERVAAIDVREELPKTMIGKLSRKELVEEERSRGAHQGV